MLRAVTLGKNDRAIKATIFRDGGFYVCWNLAIGVDLVRQHLRVEVRL